MFVSDSDVEILCRDYAVIDVLSQMIMHPYLIIWENIAISFSDSVMFHIGRLSHEKSFRGHSESKFFFFFFFFSSLL